MKFMWANEYNPLFLMDSRGVLGYICFVIPPPRCVKFGRNVNDRELLRYWIYLLGI